MVELNWVMVKGICIHIIGTAILEHILSENIFYMRNRMMFKGMCKMMVKGMCMHIHRHRSLARLI